MFPPTSLNNFILQLSRKPTDPLFSLSICPKKLDHDNLVKDLPAIEAFADKDPLRLQKEMRDEWN